MTAARRSLLEDVEAWALTLPLRVVPPPPPSPEPAEDREDVDWTPGTPSPLVTIRAGRATHLVPAHADHALCGVLTTAGPWTPAPGRPVTCSSCALPPEA